MPGDPADLSGKPAWTADQSHPEPYALTTRELAERWRISPRTLERWRHKSKGPPWLVLGGRVVCRMQDVLAYEQAHLRGG